MQKIFPYAIPPLVLGTVLFTAPRAAAKPDFTKRTGKQCIYCHAGDWTSGKYTEAGQYFKDHNTFKGYVPKPQPPSQEKAPAKH